MFGVLCAIVPEGLGEYGQQEHSVEQPSRTELVRKSNLTLYQIQSRGTCFTLFSVCATYIAKTIEVIRTFRRLGGALLLMSSPRSFRIHKT